MNRQYSFNEGQHKAITHVNGPCLCIAGPGSGKTTAIVHRIRYLIEEAGVPSASILVITFTRASAKEMENRFRKLISPHNSSCCFGTFHSVFFQILKTAYGYRAEHVLAEEQKFLILKELVRKTGLEYEDEDEVVSSLAKEISLMKGDMIPLEHFYSPSIGDDVFRSIYKQYEQSIVSAGKIDFDDMMVYCYELLKERPDILEHLRKRYRYILVDEFQDINKIQYEITKMIAAPQNNLFIVGDDDQSIYGFRGARPEIMLHFKDDFPNAVTTVLNVNYRCNRNITEGALRVISHNQMRFHKKLMSANDYEEPILIHHMKDCVEENTHLLREIQNYQKQGIAYEEMAVIMRTNIQARGILHKLMEYNIPFQIRDKMSCIYDHFTVRDILDYIRAAMGIRERAIFLRIMNKPKRYLSRELLTDATVDFDDLREKLKDKDWGIQNVDQFEYDLKVLAGLKPFAAVHFIRKAIGYDDYIREYAVYRHLDAEELLGTLDELQELAKQYKTYVEWFDGIAQYREQFDNKMQQSKARKGVTVTTMHSAKGLEYDVVFILEANEGMTPYKKADEIEEERRMFYVAMTRARHHLHIYEVKQYYNKNLEPSRFLEELVEKE